MRIETAMANSQDDRSHEFRMKEYEEIQREWMERIKELWTLEKVAFAGAAAIAAWLFSTEPTKIPSIAWWLPFVYLVICAVRFGAGMYHLDTRAAAYLIDIEKRYLGENGGYQAWFRPLGGNETYAYYLGWGTVLAASFALPFLT